MSSQRSFSRRLKRQAQPAEAENASQKTSPMARKFTIAATLAIVAFMLPFFHMASSSAVPDASRQTPIAPPSMAHLVPPQNTSAVDALATAENYGGGNKVQLASFGGQSDPGTATSTFEYGYDGLRRRMNVTQGGVTNTTDYIYDGQNLVQTRLNGGPGATYLNGPRGPEYRRDDVTGKVSWYVYDGSKNVVAEVDPNGNVTSTRNYDVFGAVRGGTNPAGTSRQKWQGGLGHLSDDNTGLVYMRGRYFDPATGRFISEDPRGHGFNWFNYASANPVNRGDFTGHEDMAEEMEADAISSEMEGENGTANLASAKWYDSKGLVKQFMQRLDMSRGQASDAIHELKKFNGLGAADNIGIDSAGGAWDKLGNFLGFIDEFAP